MFNVEIKKNSNQNVRNKNITQNVEKQVKQQNRVPSQTENIKVQNNVDPANQLPELLASNEVQAPQTNYSELQQKAQSYQQHKKYQKKSTNLTTPKNMTPCMEQTVGLVPQTLGQSHKNDLKYEQETHKYQQSLHEKHEIRKENSDSAKNMKTNVATNALQPPRYTNYSDSRLPPRREKPQQRKDQHKKPRQQELLLGRGNQWYTLNNRIHNNGTTVEMMYTGPTLPQAKGLLNIRAIPGVTHATIELPAGIMASNRSNMPDMPSLMNAMDFFRNPERHQPTPGMGPTTTIQVIPKYSNNKNIDIIDVVPLSCERAASVKRDALNTGFQSYSLMQVEEDRSQLPQAGRLVLDADISPTYLLNTHQQLRLQAAIKQDKVSLVDALVPIVEDLYNVHENLHRVGLSVLPAPIPMPYGTIRFHYGQPANLIDKTSRPIPKISVVPDAGLISPIQKKRITEPRRSNNLVERNASIMALDSNGNYELMIFSDWCRRKKEEHQIIQELDKTNEQN